MTIFQDIADINTAIFDTLKVANADLTQYSQNYDDISEGVVNLPMFQVYWQSSSTGQATDRHTFRAGIRITDLTFHVDLFVDARNHSDKIFVSMFPLFDSIEEILASQDVKPYFGLDTIKSYQYSSERATFVYETSTDTTRQYPGVRWIINIRLF